jgi:hypothetical protein
MYKADLKNILRSIKHRTVMTEGELYKKFCTSETADERSRVLSALYTLEDCGYIKCIRHGEVKHFMVVVKQEKMQ